MGDSSSEEGGALRHTKAKPFSGNQSSTEEKRSCANWMSTRQTIIGSANVNAKRMQCCPLLIAKQQAAIAKRNRGQLEP